MTYIIAIAVSTTDKYNHNSVNLILANGVTDNRDDIRRMIAIAFEKVSNARYLMSNLNVNIPEKDVKFEINLIADDINTHDIKIAMHEVLNKLDKIC